MPAKQPCSANVSWTARSRPGWRAHPTRQESRWLGTSLALFVHGRTALRAVRVQGQHRVRAWMLASSPPAGRRRVALDHIFELYISSRNLNWRPTPEVVDLRLLAGL